MKKGIYLAAYKAKHENADIIYQDINGKRDLDGNMLEIDISKYDYIIATPPCNYYSRCNYRRETSKYAQQTKQLLPEILKKLIKIDKPWIVENVRNSKIYQKMKLYDIPCFIYIIGRHTYWTNILMPTDIEQRQDFKNGGYVIKYNDMNNREHQGGYNVHNVIETFLNVIGANNYDRKSKKKNTDNKL